MPEATGGASSSPKDNADSGAVQSPTLRSRRNFLALLGLGAVATAAPFMLGRKSDAQNAKELLDANCTILAQRGCDNDVLQSRIVVLSEGHTIDEDEVFHRKLFALLWKHHKKKVKILVEGDPQGFEVDPALHGQVRTVVPKGERVNITGWEQPKHFEEIKFPRHVELARLEDELFSAQMNGDAAAESKCISALEKIEKERVRDIPVRTEHLIEEILRQSGGTGCILAIAGALHARDVHLKEALEKSNVPFMILEAHAVTDLLHDILSEQIQ